LHVHVLEDESLVAFSFPDGSIYASRGLVNRLSDDELAAALAHEIGHLLHDGIIEAPAALRGMSGPSKKADIETAADLLGREVLLSAGIPTKALPAALEKVADGARGERCYAAICSRAAYLQSLDTAGR
jgi:predicted Zn-dependent protease